MYSVVSETLVNVGFLWPDVHLESCSYVDQVSQIMLHIPLVNAESVPSYHHNLAVGRYIVTKCRSKLGLKNEAYFWL